MIDVTDSLRITIGISGQRRQIIEKLTIEFSIKTGVPLRKSEIVNAIIDRIDDIEHENLLELIILNRFPPGREPLGLEEQR